MHRFKNTRKLGLASTVLLAMITSACGPTEPSGADTDTDTGAGKGAAEDITEARQESQILTTYTLSRHLDARDLEVSVDANLATLTGKVSEDASKELAEQIALSVDDIDNVDNQIEVDTNYIPSERSGDRSYSQVVEDATITAAVKSKLLWSKHAQGLSANVDTKSGQVILLGTADNSAAKEMAGLLASNTHGVRSVDNQLVVDESREKDSTAKAADEHASDLGQSISDTWITTKVKSTLLYSSNVSSSDISVNTKDGAVTLSGKVNTDAERALAVELARNVRGVRSVNAEELTSS